MDEDRLAYYFHTYYGFGHLLQKAFPDRWNARFDSKSAAEQLAIYEAHLIADVKFCTHYELKFGQFYNKVESIIVDKFNVFRATYFNHAQYKGPVPAYHGKLY